MTFRKSLYYKKKTKKKTSINNHESFSQILKTLWRFLHSSIYFSTLWVVLGRLVQEVDLSSTNRNPMLVFATCVNMCVNGWYLLMLKHTEWFGRLEKCYINAHDVLHVRSHAIQVQLFPKCTTHSELTGSSLLWPRENRWVYRQWMIGRLGGSSDGTFLFSIGKWLCWTPVTTLLFPSQTSVFVFFSTSFNVIMYQNDKDYPVHQLFKIAHKEP